MPIAYATGWLREGTDVEWQAVAAAPAYNLTDIVALVVILFCAFSGWRRGLSGELSRFATILLALVLALRLREPLGDMIGGVTRLETPADIALAFTLVVIVALIALSILRRLLKRIMQVTFTPGLERSGGLAAGFLRGLMVVVTVFVLMNLWPHEYFNRTFGEESLVGRAIQRMLPRIREELEQLDERAPTPDTEGNDTKRNGEAAAEYERRG